MIDPKDVTVIIPHLGVTKEQRYALDECLTSLKETVPQIRVILALNGNENEALNEYFTKRIPLNRNYIYVVDQGQCKAVNAAATTVKTPWIFVTNDDMIYPEFWFEDLTWIIGEIEGKGEIRCISPILVEPKKGAPTFKEYFCGGAGGDFDKQKFLDYVKEYKELAQTDVARTGFNLPFLIKKELWDLIGGYDINYDPWGSNSDSDLEYKIRLAGVQPYQSTNCLVYHFSQTSGTSHPDNRSYWQKNWEYFIEKWGFERASSPSIWQADFEIPEDKLKFKPFWKGFYSK